MIRPAMVLTRLEWSIIADWLEHGRQFEADSQLDEPKFRWPEMSGNLLDKINAALADGANVVIRPDKVLPVINPWDDEPPCKPKSRRARP